MTDSVQSTDASVRPENVPEEFWDEDKGAVKTEELLASTAELERLTSAQEQPQDPPADHQESILSNPHIDAEPTAIGPDTITAPDPELPAEVNENPAVIAAREDFAANGELSEESYAGLEEAGMPRELVDQYIAGVYASQDLGVTKMLNVVNGQEGFDALTLWAQDELSEAEIALFNYDMQQPYEHAERALRALYERFAADRDIEPDLLHGSTGTGYEPVNAFQSAKEMVAAINDPRYATDPKYREEVAKKIAGAEKMGINLYV